MRRKPSEFGKAVSGNTGVAGLAIGRVAATDSCGG
jgi:hypothetical protein